MQTPLHRDTLKTGLIIGVKNFPSHDTILVCKRSSVPIKKGKRDGTTLLAQSKRPFDTATKLVLEKTIKQTKNKQNINGKIAFLNFIVIIEFIHKPPNLMYMNKQNI